MYNWQEGDQRLRDERAAWVATRLREGKPAWTDWQQHEGPACPDNVPAYELTLRGHVRVLK